MHLLNTVTTAIARLLGLTATVRLTQTAGLAHQEPTTKRGKKTSAQTTKAQPQSQSRVQKATTRKPRVAKSVTQDKKVTGKKSKSAQTARPK